MSSDKDSCESNVTSSTRVAYVYNEQYTKLCDQMPKIPLRASMTHSLIAAYGLLPHLQVISPEAASKEDLKLFHSEDFIDCLRRLSDLDDEEKYDDDAESYGLMYDCPAYPGVYDYASAVVGGSIAAAIHLTEGHSQVAVNWAGGWHHAKRSEASGFCYFNDIVIAILILRQKFDRVLYVDLDLHHGDGVEDAFCSTQKVMTVSFHKVASGFFPGTGLIEDIGIGRGRNYTVNVPLKDGLTDEVFLDIFSSVINRVHGAFKPQAVVCQCGADALHGDPHAAFNLTEKAFVRSVEYLREWDFPLLLLGGGGYNFANTARCWASITGSLLHKELPTDIPEHRFFSDFGPGYELTIEPGNQRDLNSEKYIEEIRERIFGDLENVEVEEDGNPR
ncbi:hypothetical protein CAPTEDRAFT_148478 [Capitella teleta]|uniref:Histone deacetylase n=1 Tax=Capitella teleta TaxID=283909 RepID=R7UB93_CAPTE|nr:hypothetical protein CAPTEDRAFT_148478 [Capitella teleta]|eukprot:ELU03635.1 hypothetical protein CAPTEDRAFT_148478 [Capitella teleta]